MDAEYPTFEPPLCSELKHLCKRLQEAYRELKEDLTPFKDDRYYSHAESCGDLQALPASTGPFLPCLVVLMGKNVHCLRLDLPDVLPSDEKTLSGPGNWSLD
ncbi:hypothetical protein mRhiFer1_017119 [Rhinolophus ferrumequinum]|uniref:Uncharacterized protein n=1 Tax=Rhinolophus ferrumequinum TaxID=59479 RepID=A0A7J7YUD8_RHIFE|nr:hypothetical protein mRhiFer1_017119 [Rhinolophus ferrumequinum]